MAAHAALSPSAAKRWIQCPASVRMAKAMPEKPDSVYAREGTAAHELAELMARDQLLGSFTKAARTKALKAWRKEFDIAAEAEAEMEEHGQSYVDYLRIRLALHPDSVLLLEQQLPTGIPGSWGTSDAIIVSPTSVESIDFKYGVGVLVEAEENPQTRLYGVGALEEYGELLGEVETVVLTIFQPRIDHVASEEISAADLKAWRDGLLPVAEQAMGDDAPFGPSEDACHWCPAAGSCMAQMEWATDRDFGVQSEHMSDDELARSLDDIPAIKKWCDAVQAHALNRAYSEGVPVPGYKVVRTNGRRSVQDHDGLIDAAVAMGYGIGDVVNYKAKGIGDLTKLLKADFAVVAAPFVTKSEGNPVLAPESDKRSAINPESQAAADFAEEAP
jgi:hypothetical protein